MQSLLGRISARPYSILEKADKQPEINKLDRLLKGDWIDIELVERHEEEIRKLELNKQELLQKIYDLSQHLYTSSSEQKRLTQELEQLKMAQRTWEKTFKDDQEQHEQEIAGLKKMVHTCRIEKEQLLLQLQETKMPHLLSVVQRCVDIPNIEVALDDNIASVPVSSAPSVESSLLKSNTIVRHEEELKTLNLSLERTHNGIQIMQLKIEMEREENIQVDKLLKEAQEKIGPFSSTCGIASMKKDRSWREKEEINDVKLGEPSLITNISADDGFIDDTNNETCDLSLKSQAIALPANQHQNCRESRDINDISCSCLVDKHKDASVGNNTIITVKELDRELTSVDQPAISNHEMYDSFSSSSSSNDSSDRGQAKVQRSMSNKEHCGSLIKEPESYIYRSRRDRIEEKEKPQSILSTFPMITTNLEGMGDAKNNIGAKNKIEKEESERESLVAAMTRTTIGDWMWKYTRKVVGSGISEHRHRRFFWIHPYSQTLYWSMHNPGSNSNRFSTKSVLVESFTVLDDVYEKSQPPSIFIKTPARSIKIQCLDYSAHDTWVKSLRYLLSKGVNHVLPTRKKPSHFSSVLKQATLQSNFQTKRKYNEVENITQQPTLSTVFNNSTQTDMSLPDNLPLNM